MATKTYEVLLTLTITVVDDDRLVAESIGDYLEWKLPEHVGELLSDEDSVESIGACYEVKEA